MYTEKLIIDNLALAQKIAKNRKKKLFSISYEELESAAYFGLVQAANSYNKNKNSCFQAYAICRISGAIKDYLREYCYGSRSKKLKRTLLLEEEFTDQNIDITFDEIIASLPTLNKTILKLYYEESYKIREIAEQFEVHESRISQILSDSRSRLSNFWKEDLCLRVA